MAPEPDTDGNEFGRLVSTANSGSLTMNRMTIDPAAFIHLVNACTAYEQGINAVRVKARAYTTEGQPWNIGENVPALWTAKSLATNFRAFAQDVVNTLKLHTRNAQNAQELLRAIRTGYLEKDQGWADQFKGNPGAEAASRQTVIAPAAALPLTSKTALKRENPYALSHAAIKAAFDTSNGNMGAADVWRGISKMWVTELNNFSRDFQKAAEGSWEGGAADTARESISRYTKRAENLATVTIDKQAGAMGNAALALWATSTRIPPVLDPAKDKSKYPDALAMETEALKREEEARRAMRDGYIQSFTELNDTIAPPDDPGSPIASQPTPGTAGPGGHHGPGVPNPGQPGAEPKTSPASATGPAATAPGPANPNSPGQQSNSPGNTQSNNPGQPGSQQNTTAASILPGSTTPSPHLPGSTTPRPGSARPSIPSPADPLKAPNAVVPGALPAPGTPGAGTPGRGPAGGTPGAPGGRGGGRKPEEDGETTMKTKDYLITAEHGEQLIGPLPKAAPPVFGVWPDDTINDDAGNTEDR